MEEKKKNWVEILVTGISAVIVLFTFILLTYQLLTEEQTPPDISVSFGTPVAKQNYYSIPVTAENNGAETAQKVRIEISAGAENLEEKAHIEFDYMPGKSKVKGWVNFSDDPTGKPLEAHVLGYVVP